MNHKLVYRLYHDEDLSLRRQRKRRHRSAVRRKPCRPATGPNEVWALDFVHDALFDGRAFRVLTAVDEYTRESLLLRRHRVLGARQSPNGCAAPSMSGALDQDASGSTTEPSSPRRPWTAGRTTAGLKWTSVGPANPPTMPLSRPSTGPSGESALSQHWFMSSDDVLQTLSLWKDDYNQNPPTQRVGRLGS